MLCPRFNRRPCAFPSRRGPSCRKTAGEPVFSTGEDFVSVTLWLKAQKALDLNR